MRVTVPSSPTSTQYTSRVWERKSASIFWRHRHRSTRFYVLCHIVQLLSGCINYTSNNHFMEDLGGGIRYYVWHHFFVRPEVHYYHIQSTATQRQRWFNTNNVLRVGASIGYTIGAD